MSLAKKSEPSAYSYGQANFDYKALVAGFIRNYLLFLIVAVAVAAAIFVPILFQTKLYTASASVMIDPRDTNITPDKEVVSDLPIDTATIDTEVEVLKSTELAEAVTRKLKLDQMSAYNPLLKDKSGSDNPAENRMIEQEIIDNVSRGLSIRRQGLTRVIFVDYTSESATLSAKVANTAVELYLKQQVDDKFSVTDEASTALRSRLDEMRDSVQVAEAAVAQYKIANGLMSADGATFAEQEISSLNQRAAEVRIEEAESRARLRTAQQQLRAGSTGEDVGEALNSPVIQALKSQRAVLSQQLAEMSSRYGALHPEILKSKRKLEDIERQIRDETQSIISNLSAQAAIQSQRAASVNQSLGSAKGKLASNNRANVRLMELERDAEAARVLYQSYLERYKQTEVQKGINTRAFARVVQEATKPVSPSSPKMALGLALALMGGLGAGTLSVLAKMATETVITTSEDVETKLGVDYLAGIASLESTVKGSARGLDPLRYILEKPLSTYAEGLRSLRASLIYSPKRENVRTIAITSSLPGEGKTTTSICLAQVISLSGQSVIVVDADLRRSSVSEVLKLDRKYGMIEVLTGKVSLDEAIVGDGFSAVKYLPLSEDVITATDVFGSEKFLKLLEELKSRFDLVVIDTAPLLPVVDTRILTKHVDVVGLLVHWRHTPRKAVEAAIDLLNDNMSKFAGVAITRVNMKEQARSGYGDSTHYYKQYKKYYHD
jgi:polysaccharide biosynthesis transport protein